MFERLLWERVGSRVGNAFAVMLRQICGKYLDQFERSLTMHPFASTVHRVGEIGRGFLMVLGLSSGVLGTLRICPPPPLVPSINGAAIGPEWNHP